MTLTIDVLSSNLCPDQWLVSGCERWSMGLQHNAAVDDLRFDCNGAIQEYFKASISHMMKFEDRKNDAMPTSEAQTLTGRGVRMAVVT